MSAPILLMPSNDNGARTLLPVAPLLGGRARFATFDSVRRENARGVLGAAATELGGERFRTPPTRLGPLDRGARDFYRRVRSMLRSERPALVVLTNDWGWPENLILSAAVAEGVPTALVQDGILDLDARGPTVGQRRWWRAWRRAGFAAGAMQPAYGANGADWHCAMGTEDAARLVRMGVAPEAIRVTGQPRFDELLRPGPTAPRPDCACLVLVGFCASPAYGFMSEGEYVRQHQLVAEALRALPGVAVAIKPHPRCNVAGLAGLEDERLRLYPPEEALVPLLRAADLFVTDISSAGVEALLLGKPVVSMPRFFPRKIRLCYGEHGLALVAEDASSLATLVEALLRGEGSAREGLARFAAAREAVCAHAGAAAERTASALEGFAMGGKP